MDRSHLRLVTYGTLSPNEPNHHEVSMIAGTWMKGIVRGTRLESGWGAAMGYPGLIADPNGPEVPVWVLESEDLPEHWARLDAFEGEGYVRAPIEVQTEGGVVFGQIYLLAEDASHG